MEPVTTLRGLGTTRGESLGVKSHRPGARGKGPETRRKHRMIWSFGAAAMDRRFLFLALGAWLHTPSRTTVEAETQCWRASTDLTIYHQTEANSCT